VINELTVDLPTNENTHARSPSMLHQDTCFLVEYLIGPGDEVWPDDYEVSAGDSEDESSAISMIWSQGEAHNHGERRF
jgi:hypothetical protein